MAVQVIWTKRVFDFFSDAANLTEFEKQVLQCRISNYTQVQTSMYLSCSVSTVAKCVARLKKKYDAVQKEHPDVLRPRRSCAVETYMDDN